MFTFLLRLLLLMILSLGVATPFTKLSKMEIVETAIAEVIPDFKEIIIEDITLNDFDTIEQDNSFTSSCLAHPINTSQEVWESLTTLVNLAKSQEWSAIGEVVAPEVHHLITEWENLSSHERAELAGHAFGKLGGDILIPESAGKIISSGIKGTMELTKASKCLKDAEQTLVLETAKESMSLFKEAQIALKTHAKKPLPEFKVRELIHKTGIPTFLRPKGIPQNYLVMISDKGGEV